MFVEFMIAGAVSAVIALWSLLWLRGKARIIVALGVHLLPIALTIWVLSPLFPRDPPSRDAAGMGAVLILILAAWVLTGALAGLALAGIVHVIRTERQYLAQKRSSDFP